MRIPRIARHQTPKTKSCASCASMFKKNIDPLRRPGRPPTPIEERNPPGSAGVPPASLFLMEVAERQRDFAGSHPVGVNLNGQTERDPRRRSGSIRVAEMGEAVPRHCAGGTPALPGGPSSTQKTGNMVYIMPRNRARRLLQASRITPPWRGSRREGGARSRAGGGQTRRSVSDDQQHSQGHEARRSCFNGTRRHKTDY